jgi:beta-phosphoglucomutase-like phosphatase (HAD superfamily)
MNDQLRHAMNAADLAEMETFANEIGATAVRTALAVREEPEHPRDDPARQKQLQEAEAQRQRDQDAALADAIETVARHRARLGRKTCSVQDGAAVRKVFELLRGLTPGAEE